MLKLNHIYGRSTQGFMLIRDKHHIKVLSCNAPIQIREWKVREVGLIKALQQLLMIAERNKKEHLVHKYKDVLAKVNQVRTQASDKHCA